MEWLSQRNFDVDIGAQLPHAAQMRVYVMEGEARQPAAIYVDIRRQPSDGVTCERRRPRRRAGIFDFAHPEPPDIYRRLHAEALKAGEDELTAIAGAMHSVGRSVLRVRARPVDHQ